MNRFFGRSHNIHDDYIVIDGSDVNHIRNVLRMRPGEKLTVTGGNSREYLCSIREIRQEEVILDIIEEKESESELPARIHLFQGLPKGDKMELIIQKCVELGVYEIVPVAMKRSVVKFDDKKAASRTARWQSISESAAKQSGRSVIPGIHSVMTFTDAVEYASEMDLRLIPYELAQGMKDAGKALSKISAGMDVAVFIGPEGGIDETELELSVKAGTIPISLGRRILRTETAGMALMAVIMYNLEIQESEKNGSIS